MANNNYSVDPVNRNTVCVWWRFRTGLEKLLLCGWTSVSFLFFALCVTIITLAALQHYSSKIVERVCLSKECLNEASRIMDYLDESVSPCHDFYRFACGKWLDSSLIPEEMDSISSFSITQDQINWKLRNLLEEPINPIESKTVKNMKNMYNSCMNLTLINKLGSKPLIKYLKLLGGWPVIEGELWNETEFDWIDSITKIRSNGFQTRFLFNIRVAPDFRRNTKYSIYLAEPIFLCLTNKELIDTNSNKIKYYLNFMVDVAVLLGADEVRAEKELKDVIRFESLIANTTRAYNSYQFLTVEELEEKTALNWSQLLSGLLSNDLNINGKESLIISNVQTVVAISQIIRYYLQNDKKVLVNYILWKIVFQSIRTLDKSFGELYDDFNLQTRPLKRNTKRWKICLKLIGTHMKTGITSLFLIRDPQKEKKKISANKIFETIRSTLKRMLAKVDWMDESTRFNAVHKTKSINKFIGYNDELLDENKIDQVYDMLGNLKNDSLFENLLKLQKWNSDTDFSKLRTNNDRNGWKNILTTTEINAYYSPFINGIKIPVWILNGIFFGANRSNYLNYGSLGWIIGHELTHPFDIIGGRFDHRGNFRDWWDVETKEFFINKSKCFVNQYQDNYPEKIGEKSKLSENMADNGGIDTAFRSYQEFVKQNGKELSLPGLSYTSNQLFWISAAQIWCSKLSPKGYKYFLQNSIHSLSEQRVQIPFSNSEDFSKAFDCKETDRMNPKHKCKVW